MELTTQQQTMAFFWAFLLGAALEIVYFAMIILRTASPPGKIAVFVGDTLYMLFVALLNFLFAVSQTEGKMVKAAFCVISIGCYGSDSPF